MSNNVNFNPLTYTNDPNQQKRYIYTPGGRQVWDRQTGKLFGISQLSNKGALDLAVAQIQAQGGSGKTLFERSLIMEAIAEDLKSPIPSVVKRAKQYLLQGGDIINASGKSNQRPFFLRGGAFDQVLINSGNYTNGRYSESFTSSGVWGD